jgi:hypothetical protein
MKHSPSFIIMRYKSCIVAGDPVLYHFITLVAFNMVSRATPTSANTASHMVAIPKAPRIKKAPLTPSAKKILFHTIARVFLATVAELAS